ncbi:MAG: SIS domain-containing protein [Actinomycetota bacterium]|nr:SIS domain-containing protein [Actinomycetota bacterium]
MTDFLYPFIDAEERDASSLLTDLARSAEAKAAESRDLAADTLAASGDAIAAAAGAIAERFTAGGRLFAFGNGGSSTDAAGVATLLVRPPTGPSLPARSLAADTAVLTALGNDVGFDLVFSRQLIAYASASDIALGLSTSGSSENLAVAFAEARHRGLLTIGLAGFDGGRMAVSPDIDHCIVVRSDSVHRIQEAQAAVIVALWRGVHRALDGERVDAS